MKGEGEICLGSIWEIDAHGGVVFLKWICLKGFPRHVCESCGSVVYIVCVKEIMLPSLEAFNTLTAGDGISPGL